MNLTTVSHHLSLLDLPPLLDAALKSGRRTSPRTLHEPSKLHESQPDAVRALLCANPHVHISVRAEGRDGRRLNPRKEDLHR